MKTLHSSLSLFLMAPVLAAAAGFEINRFTMSGGGGTSSGGPFLVSGTIGQPAAGGLGGGTFSVDGGFWSVPVAVQVPNAPTLQITTLIAAPGFAILSWDSSVTGYSLQVRSSLETGIWENAPSGATNPVSVLATGPARFYRLIKR